MRFKQNDSGRPIQTEKTKRERLQPNSRNENRTLIIPKSQSVLKKKKPLSKKKPGRQSLWEDNQQLLVGQLQSLRKQNWNLQEGMLQSNMARKTILQQMQSLQKYALQYSNDIIKKQQQLQEVNKEVYKLKDSQHRLMAEVVQLNKKIQIITRQSFEKKDKQSRKVKQTSQKINNLTNQLNERTKEAKKFLAGKMSAQDKMESLLQQIKTLQGQKSSLQIQIDQIKAQRLTKQQSQLLKMETLNLKHQNQSSMQQLARLSSRLIDSQSNLVKQSKQFTELERLFNSKLESCIMQIDQLNQRLSDSSLLNQQLGRLRDQLQNQLNSVKSVLSKRCGQYQSLHQKYLKLKRNSNQKVIEQLEQTVKKLQNQRAEMKQNENKLAKAISQTELRQLDLKKQLQIAKEKVSSLDKDLKQSKEVAIFYQNQISSLQKKSDLPPPESNSKLSKQIEFLQQYNNRLQNSLASLRSKFAQLHNQTLGPIVFTLQTIKMQLQHTKIQIGQIPFYAISTCQEMLNKFIEEHQRDRLCQITFSSQLKKQLKHCTGSSEGLLDCSLGGSGKYKTKFTRTIEDGHQFLKVFYRQRQQILVYSIYIFLKHTYCEGFTKLQFVSILEKLISKFHLQKLQNVLSTSELEEYIQESDIMDNLVHALYQKSTELSEQILWLASQGVPCRCDSCSVWICGVELSKENMGVVEWDQLPDYQIQ